MTDVIPPQNRWLHHLANEGLRKADFVPGLQPLCAADFIEDRPTMPIRVLCLGMPRTGTMSLGAALGILGYKCYNHIEACKSGPRDMRCWNEALEAKYFGKGKKYGKDEFAKILKGFDAVADAPAVPYFAEELIEAFPDAKVILTERPIDDWVKSISKTVAIAFGWKTWPLVAWAEPATKHWYQEAVIYEKISNFGDAFTPEQRLLRAEYTEYYDRIRKVCPKERLLEFKTGVTGMQELCDFLGHEPPAGVSYPRINESATFVPMYAMWYWGVFRIAARKVLTRALIGFATFWIVWRRRRLLPSFWKQLKDFVTY